MGPHDVDHSVAARAALVGQVPLFAHLPADALRAIAQQVTPRFFPARHILYSHGSDVQQLFVVHTGSVKTFHVTAEGREQVLDVLTEGQFLGEHSVLTPHTADHYAQVVDAAEICVLRASDLKALLSVYPGIAWAMLGHLSTRVRHLDRTVTALAGDTASVRVARYLLDAVRHAGSESFRLSAAKKDVASLLGLTAETFSRRLTELEVDGVITLSGQRHVTVADRDRLEGIALGRS